LCKVGFKLWGSDLSRRCPAKRDYAEVARRTVKEMHREVGELAFDERGLARRELLVRHLVMPGLPGETEAILRWIADELGAEKYVDVMAQYYPVGRTGSFRETDRRLHAEFERALSFADALGLRRVDARSHAAAAHLARSAAAPRQPGAERGDLARRRHRRDVAHGLGGAVPAPAAADGGKSHLDAHFEVDATGGPRHGRAMRER
jgi:hypothetical protein